MDEALYEGFVHGVALNFDYVSFGKHHNDATEITDKEKDEEHERNLKKAELEADWLTRHRPLESTVVGESESDIYSLFNITIHYMTSRSQAWRLVEPQSEHLEDANEHHMIFISESSDNEDRHIPRNMILSVGNISKSTSFVVISIILSLDLPEKRGKTPILLTCLETFIVSKLVYSLMSRLLESTAPIDVKLKYIDRWIHLAQHHFVLYLPYVTITAQRCFDMLDDNGTVKSQFDFDPYKNLHANCKAVRSVFK